jgi:16S rRNA (guanine966-N2)-methyltransferase
VPRIIGGQNRGRVLRAPAGHTTRPTAQRLRQAIFDMLLHAPWAGRGLLDGAHILDAFAGTGAMGLEALSRGAGRAVFMERDEAALAALKANIALCRAEARAVIRAVDVLHPGRGGPQQIIFLDPPYEGGLTQPAIAALRAGGWIVPGSLIIAEYARGAEPVAAECLLASIAHGAGRIEVWRER